MERERGRRGEKSSSHKAGNNSQPLQVYLALPLGPLKRSAYEVSGQSCHAQAKGFGPWGEAFTVFARSIKFKRGGENFCMSGMGNLRTFLPVLSLKKRLSKWEYFVHNSCSFQWGVQPWVVLCMCLSHRQLTFQWQKAMFLSTFWNSSPKRIKKNNLFSPQNAGSAQVAFNDPCFCVWKIPGKGVHHHPWL